MFDDTDRFQRVEAVVNRTNSALLGGVGRAKAAIVRAGRVLRRAPESLGTRLPSLRNQQEG